MPIGFVSDHLEILYDIDHGAREEAEREGIVFARIESLNSMPLFIQALASIVRRTLDEAASGIPPKGHPEALAQIFSGEVRRRRTSPEKHSIIEDLI